MTVEGDTFFLIPDCEFLQEVTFASGGQKSAVKEPDLDFDDVQNDFHVYRKEPIYVYLMSLVQGEGDDLHPWP